MSDDDDMLSDDLDDNFMDDDDDDYLVDDDDIELDIRGKAWRNFQMLMVLMIVQERIVQLLLVRLSVVAL